MWNLYPPAFPGQVCGPLKVWVTLVRWPFTLSVFRRTLRSWLLYWTNCLMNIGYVLCSWIHFVLTCFHLLGTSEDLQQPSSPSVKKTEEKGVSVVHEVKCKLYVKVIYFFAMSYVRYLSALLELWLSFCFYSWVEFFEPFYFLTCIQINVLYIVNLYYNSTIF